MMRKLLKKLVSPCKRYLMHDVELQTDRLLMIAGKNAASQLRQIHEVNSLSDAGFSVYSQFDEDGIVEWLLQRVPIASTRFVEFGVSNYKESNTRFLLKNRNWRGLVLDCGSENIGIIHNDEISWKHELLAYHAFVTPENINDILKKSDFTGEIGLLSVDAGGMDYWIWKAIEVIAPCIVICEYNAIFGDLHPVSIPYAHDFDRAKAHYSDLYWGAGIVAFENVARLKGYTLIGSNAGGHNAFFIRDDLFEHLNLAIADKSAKPSLFRESRSLTGNFTYVSGIKRFDMIKHLTVVRVDTGEKVALETLSPVYSKAWMNILGDVA
ncbi:MAG: hypothetical protein AB1805_03360 [Nitrospirota bacterium]